MPTRPQTRKAVHAFRGPPAGNEAVVDLRDGSARSARKSRSRGSREGAGKEQLRDIKVFGSPAFRRLWFSQLASSLGDWIGLVAITAIANRIGGGGVAGLGGVSLVLAARLVPGFFFSPIAGVLADRFNRKTIMVLCDFGRAIVLCSLAFVDNLISLFIASLVLELLTLMWSTAKEASVPNLVKPEFLASANSLSIAAAYGPLLIAPGLFALLAKVPEWTGNSTWFHSLNLNNESVALYFDGLTYLISAAVIATLAIPSSKRVRTTEAGTIKGAGAGFAQAREGLRYVKTNARVRSVMIGLATGLIGGAMVVPLGPSFSDVALDAGSAGYGLLLTGLGTGVAIGVMAITLVQKRLNVDRMFLAAIFGSGASLLIAASMTGLTAAVICTGILGLFGGGVYVLGYTSVQVNTIDEMRGRVFATLYTVTRSCILLALVAAPLLAVAFGSLADRLWGGAFDLGDIHIETQGVRLTFWFGGLILLLAGLLATRSLGRGLRESAETEA